LLVPILRGTLCWLQEVNSTSSGAESAGGSPAQGNALGSGTINRLFRALQRRGLPPPFQGGHHRLARYTRGVAPGLASSAPLARHDRVLS